MNDSQIETINNNNSNSTGGLSYTTPVLCALDVSLNYNNDIYKLSSSDILGFSLIQRCNEFEISGLVDIIDRSLILLSFCRHKPLPTLKVSFYPVQKLQNNTTEQSKKPFKTWEFLIDALDIKDNVGGYPHFVLRITLITSLFGKRSVPAYSNHNKQFGELSAYDDFVALINNFPQASRTGFIESVGRILPELKNIKRRFITTFHESTENAFLRYLGGLYKPAIPEDGISTFNKGDNITFPERIVGFSFNPWTDSPSIFRFNVGEDKNIFEDDKFGVGYDFIGNNNEVKKMMPKILIGRTFPRFEGDTFVISYTSPPSYSNIGVLTSLPYSKYEVMLTKSPLSPLMNQKITDSYVNPKNTAVSARHRTDILFQQPIQTLLDNNLKNNEIFKYAFTNLKPTNQYVQYSDNPFKLYSEYAQHIINIGINSSLEISPYEGYLKEILNNNTLFVNIPFAGGHVVGQKVSIVIEGVSDIKSNGDSNLSKYQIPDSETQIYNSIFAGEWRVVSVKWSLRSNPGLPFLTFDETIGITRFHRYVEVGNH